MATIRHMALSFAVALAVLSALVAWIVVYGPPTTGCPSICGMTPIESGEQVGRIR